MGSGLNGDSWNKVGEREGGREKERVREKNEREGRRIGGQGIEGE